MVSEVRHEVRQCDHMGPRAGEHEGHVGPRAGEHEGHMGPRSWYSHLLVREGRHELRGLGIAIAIDHHDVAMLVHTWARKCEV